MAELSAPRLIFDGGCPDPGRREIKLPTPLPGVGDDFDWQQRDYDSIRQFMQSELVARYPERSRWTAADLELVLIEIMAAGLDQLSDMADRVAAESYLETARRPEAVLNWLRFIGMQPLVQNELKPDPALLAYWRQFPHEMEQARRAGPLQIHRQERMVSLEDYGVRLAEHPLVHRAKAWRRWSGSWTTVNVTLSLWGGRRLDQALLSGSPLPPARRVAIDKFHQRKGLLIPDWPDDTLCARDILHLYLEPYRMTAQEVILRDTAPVGIHLRFCIHLGPNHFRSEVRREILRVLGKGPGGFFEPGRLLFGQDLHQGDFFERLMSLDGVNNIEVLDFRRTDESAEVSQTKTISVGDLELAICDNDPARPARGLIRVVMRGGLSG